MKIKDVIAELEKLDPELDVYLHDNDCVAYPATSVLTSDSELQNKQIGSWEVEELRKLVCIIG